MATNEDALDLDNVLGEFDQIESNADSKLQVKNRFQQLANDKREIAQQKEAEAKARAEAEARAKEAEMKAEFYKNFNSVSSKYPEAANFQDQILERVSKGIDMEEATLGILAKEGKFGAPAPAPMPTPSPEGGSALNTIPDGPKDLADMSQNEMFDALREAEKNGELQQTLRRGINLG